MKKLLFLLASFLHFSQIHATPVLDTIIFVDENAGGANTGYTWTDALTDLQDALDTARANPIVKEIWVASGTYKPHASDFNTAFNIPDSLRVYGGFAGGEDPASFDLDARDFMTDETILSGDINAPNFDNDNSFHVITTFGVSPQTLVDGFTIKDGYARSNQAQNFSWGGGWLNEAIGDGVESSPTIRNCIFEDNQAFLGGGMYSGASSGGIANPTFINSVFRHNTGNSAGGVYFKASWNSASSSPTFFSCLFFANTTPNGGGAFILEGSFTGSMDATFDRCEFSCNSAFQSYGSSGAGRLSAYSDGSIKGNFKNCLIQGNYAGNIAGGIDFIAQSEADKLTLTNCSIVENAAGNKGGGMVISASGPVDTPRVCITNSIIWNNKDQFGVDSSITSIWGFLSVAAPTMTYSLVRGWNDPGDGNIDGTDPANDPLFKDQVVPPGSFALCLGDYALRQCSPAINAGTLDSLGVGDSLDVFGNTRIQQGAVDLGAIESSYDGVSNIVIYVDSSNASGTEDGESWATAYTDLQDAIDAACEKDTIWVAVGTYFPSDSFGLSPTNPRGVSFSISKNIVILGGFAGGELSSADRNWDLYPAVLSGDLGTPYNNSDNAYHVVWMEYLDSCAILDGFRIQEGNANGVYPHDQGGGVYNNGRGGESNPTFSNCSFRKNNANLGGGFFNDGSTSGESNPTLIGCSFVGNTANEGGGLYSDAILGKSNARLLNCAFIGNSATFIGGGMSDVAVLGTSYTSITNCIFSGNNAQTGGGLSFYNDLGGGIYPTITNCTFSGNNATNSGGGLHYLASISDPTLTNNIFFGNSSGVDINIAVIGITSIIKHSLIQGIDTGSTNIIGTTDPLFVDMPDHNNAPTTEGDLRLLPCSPVINRGANDSIPVGALTDLDGAQRIQRDTVDLGAFETPYQQGQNGVIYVDSSNISGTENGYSWATAFTNLQDAIDVACEKDTLWVAQGTYFPTTDFTGTPNNRLNNFSILNKNLVILGGFEGDEHSSNDRDWVEHPTILSGDLGVRGDSTDNAYHVFYMVALDSCSILDGFTICEGNADDLTLDNKGGAVFNNGGSGASNPTFKNCLFMDNFASESGGAVYNYGLGGQANSSFFHCTFLRNNTEYDGGAVCNLGQSGQSDPTFTNCSFLENNANSAGGAVYNHGAMGQSDPTFINCSFSGNKASINGGAVYNYSFNGYSNPNFHNCSFSGNKANYYGGAVYNNGDDGQSDPTFTNCSFSGNKANLQGGAVFNDGASGQSDPTFNNTVIWGNSIPAIEGYDNNNPSYHFSLIQGEIQDTSGNIPDSINPQFVLMPDTLAAPTTIGNLRLKSCSPLINAGSNGLVASEDTADLDGAERIQKGSVDIGAYESPFEGTGNVIIYVDSSNTDTLNNGSSWATAFSDLQDALCMGCGKDTIWVAEGTYYPTDSLNKFTPVDPREASFYIDSNLVILGGFEGDETSADERDWKNYPTILSGNIGDKDSTSDNSYHVLYILNVDSCMLLDGFTIRDGWATKSIGIFAEPRNSGGGLFNIPLVGSESSPTLKHCQFINNRANIFGGAVYNSNGRFASVGPVGITKPTFTKCSFSGNNAITRGGAVYNNGFDSQSDPSFNNCSFSGNNTNSNGGAVYNYGRGGQSDPTFNNCSFSGNNANGIGGAVYNYGFDGQSDPTFNNCSFSGNNANGIGGAVYSYGFDGQSDPTFNNTVIWGNSTPAIYNFHANSAYYFSLIQGEIQDTSGNIPDSINPQFVLMPDYTHAPTTTGNLHLKPCSPLINAGSNGLVPPGDTIDLDGAERIQNTTVDIGAYESPFDGTGNVVIYVDSSNTDTLNNGGSWATAFADLQDALCMGCEKDTIWVAQGTYFPSLDKDKEVNIDPRKHTFYIDSNLVILGGFEGDETSDDQRDWGIYQSILSGDLGIPEDSSDNAYRIVHLKELDTCMVLDGFIIKEAAGKPGSSTTEWGGGIYNDGSGGNRRSNPSISNCSFTENVSGFGSAIFNNGSQNGQANPRIISCSFLKNHSWVRGGAVLNFGLGGEASPVLSDCKFKGNSADDHAGAMFNDATLEGLSSPILINCLFSGNHSGDDGGALYSIGHNYGKANPRIINCSFSGNVAVDKGGAMYNRGVDNGESNAVISNSLLWGNHASLDSTLSEFGIAQAIITYSLLENHFPPGDGNLDGTGTQNDPSFIDQPDHLTAPTCDGNLRLNNCSPVIDIGENDSIPPGINDDLDGNNRIVNGIVDFGVYEYDGPPPILSCNDVTLTFDGGSAILMGLDSALVVSGSDPCFDSIVFSQKIFDCADLANTPIQITVSATSINGFFDQCNANIHLLEDPDYCCSYGGSSDLNHIKSVRLESSEDTLENVTNNDNGYGDYQHLVTEVNAGAKLDITLMSFTVNPITYKYWYVWIDFNGNGDFSTNELVYQADGGQSMRTFKVTIPAGLNSGNRAMRIAMQLNPGFPDPCEVFPLGEVEDYTLYINACPDVLLLEDQSLGGVYFAGKEIRTKGEVLVTEDTKFMSQEFFLGKEFRVQDGVKFETVKSPCNVWLAPPPIID